MAGDIPSRNNFDLVRFVLAMTVCLVHAGQLPGLSETATLGGLDELATEVAVPAFFVVSGLLIMRSYERSSSVWSYLEKRARRIFPGYGVVVLGAAFALGAVSTAPDFYFTRDWWAYLGANLTTLGFLHPTLPGVFENHLEPAVNGALWTIKIEIGFYLLVPLLAHLRRQLGTGELLLSVFVLSTCWAMVMPGQLAHQLPGQLRYFVVGAAFYYGWPKLGPHLTSIGLLSAAALALHQWFAIGPFYPLAIGGFTLAVALGHSLGDFGKHGDISYGIYILHFPIVQVFIEFGLFQLSPWVGVLASVWMTLACAVLLWHLVEAPALHRRPVIATSHFPLEGSGAR